MALVPYSDFSPFADTLRLAVRHFTFGDAELTIQQNWGEDGRGGSQLGFGTAVQHGAILLAEYIVQHPELVRGQRCVELGTGPGLVGIVAAAVAGARSVACTDGDQELLATLVNQNMVKNFGPPGEDGRWLEGRLWHQPLLWGQDEHHQRVPVPVDVILAADIVACVYTDSFRDLIATIVYLFDRGGARHMLLSYRQRHHSEKLFFERLTRKGFVLKECPSVSRHGVNQTELRITIFHITKPE